MDHYLLGMDLGTTNLKAVVLDEAGQALASASASYPLIMPGPNQVEQDPAAWWAAALSVFRSVTGQMGPAASHIRGISVSSQFPTLLPLDREGNVLRNAIIWMDKRAHRELEEILDTVGLEEYIASAGGRPDVSFLPCKLLWMKRHEPELLARTYRILQANGYINYKLTGVMSADVEQASLGQCLDLRTLAWSMSMAITPVSL